MKRYIYIIILTFIFTFFIFYIKNVFFSVEDKRNIENKYMERSLSFQNNNGDKINSNTTSQKNNNKLDYQKIKQKILELRKQEEEKRLASKVSFLYIPKNYEEQVISYTKILSSIVRNNIFNEKIISLTIEMYKKKIDVRGKMKNEKVELFGIINIKDSEFTSLFLHEFAHYIDLYFFKKTIISDESDKFYNISWKSTKILKKGQKTKDFVSGYAMTNKYEDFAESFTYYVLHNGDFYYKSGKSNILKNKYNFFKKNLFKNNSFVGKDFSINKKILDYYRDITKIDIKEQNFLQYLKK